MISSKSLNQLLKVARRHRVAKIKFQGEGISILEFFPAPRTKKVLAVHKEVVGGGPRPLLPMDLSTLQVEGMPTDEEFKYYHSPIVPAPEAIPQEEQRKAS